MILTHIQNMINIRAGAQMIIEAYNGAVYARTMELLSRTPRVQISDETIANYATLLDPTAEALYALLHGLYIIEAGRPRILPVSCPCLTTGPARASEQKDRIFALFKIVY